MRRLAIADDGIETRSFAAAKLLSQGPDAHHSHTLPPDLRELLYITNKVNFADGVVPLALKDETLAAADMMSMYVPPSAFSTPQHHGGRPAPAPTVDDAVDLVCWAARLQNTKAEEAAWNSLVHSRLLSLALYERGRIQQAGLVGFTQW